MDLPGCRDRHKLHLHLCVFPSASRLALEGTRQFHRTVLVSRAIRQHSAQPARDCSDVVSLLLPVSAEDLFPYLAARLPNVLSLGLLGLIQQFNNSILAFITENADARWIEQEITACVGRKAQPFGREYSENVPMCK